MATFPKQNEKGDIRILLRRGWRPASARRGAGEAEAGAEENHPHAANQANQCDVDSKFPSVLHPPWHEPSFEKSAGVKALDRRPDATVPGQLHSEAWYEDTTTQAIYG